MLKCACTINLVYSLQNGITVETKVNTGSINTHTQIPLRANSVPCLTNATQWEARRSGSPR